MPAIRLGTSNSRCLLAATLVVCCCCCRFLRGSLGTLGGWLGPPLIGGSRGPPLLRRGSLGRLRLVGTSLLIGGALFVWLVFTEKLCVVHGGAVVAGRGLAVPVPPPRPGFCPSVSSRNGSAADEVLAAAARVIPPWRGVGCSDIYAGMCENGVPVFFASLWARLAGWRARLDVCRDPSSALWIHDRGQNNFEPCRSHHTR